MMLYVHAKSQQQAAQKLTDTMNQVAQWLINSRLHLTVRKTVCMFFTKRPDYDVKADVFVQKQKLEVVHEFKYLGLLLDSQLSFKKHVKKVVNIAKFNLANFRFIRNSLTNEAAVLFMNSMIIPHITYCMTTWTQTRRSFLKPVEIIYKQTLKVLDKKNQTVFTIVY